MNNQALGNWGEDKAADFLISNGYQILDRNARTTYGEIDIVAKVDHTIIFVEVKTRTSNKFGHPEEAITKNKLTHMIDSAQDYLQIHPEIDSDLRIDVIAIRREKNGDKIEISHFENVQSDE